jgi:lipoyl(octanoyl) transferase
MTRRHDIVSASYFNDTVRWDVSNDVQPYLEAVARMEHEVAEIAAGRASELVWLVEHPALYTAGTSAMAEDLVTPDRFPVFSTGRGGQYTYHGPGQRVAYVMLDLKKRGGDVRGFVAALERWIIATLAKFSIQGENREDRVGVWVARPGREDKIAALGIRVRRGITFHGLSINVDPDLTHFDGIVPCGVTQHGVTSFSDLGVKIPMALLDQALSQTFEEIFGPIRK